MIWNFKDMTRWVDFKVFLFEKGYKTLYNNPHEVLDFDSIKVSFPNTTNVECNMFKVYLGSGSEFDLKVEFTGPDEVGKALVEEYLRNLPDNSRDEIEHIYETL